MTPRPAAQEFDLWKAARKHLDEARKVLQRADGMPLADQTRLLLMKQGRDHMRAFATELDKNIIAEEHHNERGWSAYNVSLFDDSAEPILVG
jgi:hypothetical protein